MRQKKFRVVDLRASALDVVVDDVFLNCRGHLLPTLCTLAPLVDHLVLVVGQNSRFRQPCLFDLFYYRKFWAQCSVSFRDKKIAAKSLIFCRKCAKNELQHWQSASSRENSVQIPVKSLPQLEIRGLWAQFHVFLFRKERSLHISLFFQYVGNRKPPRLWERKVQLCSGCRLDSLQQLSPKPSSYLGLFGAPIKRASRVQ